VLFWSGAVVRTCRPTSCRLQDKCVSTLDVDADKDAVCECRGAYNRCLHHRLNCEMKVVLQAVVQGEASGKGLCLGASLSRCLWVPGCPGWPVLNLPFSPIFSPECVEVGCSVTQCSTTGPPAVGEITRLPPGGNANHAQQMEGGDGEL
jgi:hypothetical protein